MSKVLKRVAWIDLPPIITIGGYNTLRSLHVNVRLKEAHLIYTVQKDGSDQVKKEDFDSLFQMGLISKIRERAGQGAEC